MTHLKTMCMYFYHLTRFSAEKHYVLVSVERDRQVIIVLNIMQRLDVIFYKYPQGIEQINRKRTTAKIYKHLR